VNFTLPSAGEIHVRRFDLDKEWDMGNARWECLSEDEKARAGRFHFARDANRWAAGRSLLRGSLGAYLGLPAESLQFETGPWGKLALRDCPLRFNVSHSGACLLLAFAWQQEVGIDAEQIRSDFVPEELALQVFSPSEQAWLRDCPAGSGHQAFLTLWTAKEAYVKAAGNGLSFPLTQLTLTLVSGSDQFHVQDLTPADAFPPISVGRLSVGPDYCAAFALAGSFAHVLYDDSCHDTSN
jgi:4'-phosphopantetheinyl transferase